jgi:hypothetical protein
VFHGVLLKLFEITVLYSFLLVHMDIGRLKGKKKKKQGKNREERKVGSEQGY